MAERPEDSLATEPRFHVAYALRRGEVWRWYWRAWRHGLWMFHVLVVAVIAAEVYAASPKAPLATGVLLPTLLCALPVLALLVAYPQICFKPQTRTMTLTAAGLDSTIKGTTRTYLWSDLRSVVDRDGYLFIETGKKNAFIVPPRAFATPAARAACVTFARQALAAKLR